MVSQEVFVIPASPAQERLWLLDRLEPGSAAFNLPASVRLAGRLDVAALVRSLDAIVRRHEILRTTFTQEGGQAEQVIHPGLEIELPVVDLTGMAAAERPAAAAAIAAREALLPFDLARGPLLRTSLLRLGPGEHVLLVTLHHIVADGWSLGILIRELSAFYTAFVEGRPVSLPELPIQYADYACWQRERLQKALEGQLDYWRRHLAGLAAAEALTPDRPRADRGLVGRASAASLEAALPPELGEALRALARRERATPFVLLLAAFKALLHRVSGHDEIVIGAPVAGRNRGETKDLIGLFLNTLVLRSDLAGDPTFLEVLARVRDTVAQALANQDVPFEKLIEELRPERSRTPFFQAFFNMLSFPRGDFELPGLRAEYLPAVESGAKFDLTVYAEDAAEGIRFRWVYDADLFARERMAELLDQYLLLLRQVAAAPGERISAPTLLTQRGAAALPDPAAPLGEEWYGPVQEALARHALSSPQRVAVADRDGAWTYAELDARANRLANRLLAQGIERGEIVAVWGHRGRPLVAAMLGVLKAGAALTILDPAHPAPRLAACLRLAEPRAWVALAGAAVPTEVEETLADLALRCRIELAAAVDPRGDGLPADGPDGAPGVVLGPDDIAVVSFTSGSTGAPKGILGRHGPLSHFLPWQAERFGLGETDRFSVLSGLSHDPLQRDVFTPLWLGGTIRIPDPDRLGQPGWLGEWMEREGITVCHLTPAMGRLITDTSPAGLRLPSLRWAFFVGEALTWGDEARLRRLAQGVRCANFYGSTETQRAVAYYVLPVQDSVAPEDRGVLPLGRGMQDVQLLVLNRAGRLAGIGERGEIHVRSPHLARGYIGRPELTTERFLCNPFGGGATDRVYRTGDLGRYLPDGNVEFLGRADDQVQIRGFRVEPAEVQQVLVRHSGVRQAVVMARGEGLRDRRLVAYVVPAGAGAPPATELRAFLLRWLPDYMVPSAFVVLGALPLLPNGKLDRAALPEPAAAVEDEGEAAGLRTPTEEILAGIWRELLGTDRVGAEDDFFALGGHSLLATQLVSRCQEVFGIEVLLRLVFDAPVLAVQAERLDALRRQGRPAPPPIRPVSRDGGIPLSYAQERLWFIDQLEPGNPLFNLPAAVRLAGRLDVPAFAAALGEVGRRHEVLRTVFRQAEGGPVQEILPAAPVPLPIVDLSALPAAAREAEWRRWVAGEAVRPFDLKRGPLLRALLLRIEEGEHVTVLTLHHVASDRWSSSILFREVATLYGAFAARRPAPLPELRVQYADYAAWQRSWLTGDVLEAQLGYWERQLAGAPASPTPPAAPLRSGRPARRGAAASGSLSPELLTGLAALSRREGATLFMTLTAILEMLLQLYTGQEDIVVGTDIANRTRVETEGLIGFFVNQLVLRCDLSGEPSFPEVLRRVRQVTLAAYAHQDVPFQKVVERLRPERAERSPFFQVKINLHNVPVSRVEAAGLALQTLEADRGVAQLDLILNFTETPEGLAVRAEYDAGRFEPETIARLLRHLEVLASQLIADPETSPAQLRQCLERVDREERMKIQRELEGVALGSLGRIGRKPVISAAGEAR